MFFPSICHTFVWIYVDPNRHGKKHIRRCRPAVSCVLLRFCRKGAERGPCLLGGSPSVSTVRSPRALVGVTQAWCCSCAHTARSHGGCPWGFLLLPGTTRDPTSGLSLQVGGAPGARSPGCPLWRLAPGAPGAPPCSLLTAPLLLSLLAAWEDDP